MATSPTRDGSESQSKRKRQAGHDGRFVRRKKPSRRLSLMDLPVDILCKALSYVGPSLSDRFALQTTNKLFRNLSNRNELTQYVQFLLPPPVPDGESPLPVIQERDSSELIVRRLLPFAKAGNRDALLVLGLQAIYVEDDCQVGLRLLQKGMDKGDSRCKYSIACFLGVQRQPGWAPETNQRLLEEAAQSGHALSSLSLPKGEAASTNILASLPSAIQRHGEARQEMAALVCLKHLMDNKPSPPYERWKGYKCDNPLCFRKCYKINKKRVREWLKQKRYTSHWMKYRPSLMAVGSQTIPEYSSSQGMQFVPRMNFVPLFLYCSGCEEAHYCSQSCQALHWQKHKLVCGR